MLRIRLLSLAVLMSGMWTTAIPETPEAPPMQVTLPHSVDGWTLSGPAKRIEPKAIFDYMDGAGELYLGYRFRFLEVSEYTKSGESDILVELYWMESPDDAYGLLSGDWGGESVDLASAAGHPAPPLVRALYGAGLLRIWSGDLFARVLTYQESDSSRAAVLALGNAIVAGRPKAMPPRLVQALPQTAGPGYRLRADRTVYLRSHLVLNSVYFLSSENLLDLGLNCEAAAAVYRRNSGAESAQAVRVLLVRYADAASARKALTHFQAVYLSGKLSAPADRGVASIEDGWAGFILSGNGLGLVFEAPDEPSARLLLENARQAIDKVEDPHE